MKECAAVIPELKEGQRFVIRDFFCQQPIGTVQETVGHRYTTGFLLEPDETDAEIPPTILCTVHKGQEMTLLPETPAPTGPFIV